MLKQNLIKWAVAAALATPIAPILAGSSTQTLRPASLSARTTTPAAKLPATTPAAKHLHTGTVKHHKMVATAHRRVTTNSHKLRAASKLAKHHHKAAALSTRHQKVSGTSMSLPSSLPSIDAAGQRT